MRFLSFNIHGCVGRGGTFDPEKTHQVIEEADADIVALQEVYSSDRYDCFLQSLHRRFTNYRIIHGPTMRKADADYGNIFMSRIPVQSHQQIDISQPLREPRGAIRALLSADGNQPTPEIEVIATHLGLTRGERRRQIEQLIHELSVPFPDAPGGNETMPLRILMGDLNEWNPRSRNSILLRDHFGKPVLAPCFPARMPLLALDRVHVEDNEVDCRVVKPETIAARTASDHLPLLIELGFQGRHR